VGGRRINFTNFGEGINMVDIDTGEVRPSTKQDVKDIAKVVDACEHYGVYERAVNPTDIAAPVAPLHNFEGSVLNTSKHHLIGPVTTLNAQAMIDCAAAIQGGYDELKKRPLLSFTLSPISPLKLVDHVTKIARLAGKYGVPCNFINMGMAGATTPVQLAGTMVCHNAELLAAVCYTQIMNEGAPLIYGTSTTGMDLRKANASVGTPELALIGASHAQIAKFYKFPCLCAGG
jgi:trimethylamine--corrinoid protein Co-methyltransferase